MIPSGGAEESKGETTAIVPGANAQMHANGSNGSGAPARAVPGVPAGSHTANPAPSPPSGLNKGGFASDGFFFTWVAS